MKHISKETKRKLTIIIIFLAYLIILNFSGHQQAHQSSDLFISSTETFQFDNQNHSVKDSKQNQYDSIKQVKREKWEFPHNVWIYQDIDEEKPSKNFHTFRQLNILNTKHFSHKSNYTVFEINKQNYQQHLSPSASEKVASVIKLLQERLSSDKYENAHREIKENKEIIIKRLIVYFALNEKGGVFVNDDVTVVESFDNWLEDILNVVDINVGDRHSPNLKAKCFGFYNKDFSSLRMKVNVEREFKFQKKMVVFPSLDDDLIACEQKTEFMTLLIEAYLDILFKERQSLRISRLNKNETLIGRTNQWQIYNHGNLLALHSILQQRQHSLNFQNGKQKHIKLAIDSFGFITMNRNVGTNKLRHYMGVRRQMYAFLAKIQIKYLVQLSGELRFAHKLDYNIMAYFSQHLASQLTPPEFFMKNSFFHTFLLSHWPKNKVYKDFRYITPIKYESLKDDNTNREVIEVREPPIAPEPDESEDNSQNPQWQSIEKNLWIIWDKGLKGNSNLVVELCFQNLKKSAQNSGYKLNFVTDNNVHEYLDNQILQKINYALTHATYEVTQQVKTDLWRLALVYKHGGVYVDATTLNTEDNFDFVQNITRIPSAFIWNRYEKQPTNLIFWHAHYGHPSNWKVNYKYATKQQWHLSYENNFIAAEKGSELIGQWLDMLMEWMVTQYEVIQDQMREVTMWNSRWIRPNDRYLLAMDAIKYVIGRRQKWLKDTNNNKYQSASHYYNIWGMTGNMNGQQKLRGESNFQNSDYRLPSSDRDCNNLYRYQYSIEYVQNLIGPLSYQNKFFGFDSKQMNIILQHFSLTHNDQITEESLYQIIHPQSLFSKLLHVDIQKSLQLIKFYSKLRQSRTKSRIFNKATYSI